MTDQLPTLSSPSQEASADEPTTRRPFIAPALERHDELPRITFSSDLFGDGDDD